MKGVQLFLKPDEAKFLSMAVVSMMEQLNTSSKDITIPWNPEARKDLKEMIASGNMLAKKLTKLGFDMRDLPPYVEGEEKDFFTKQS